MRQPNTQKYGSNCQARQHTYPKVESVRQGPHQVWYYHTLCQPKCPKVASVRQVAPRQKVESVRQPNAPKYGSNEMIRQHTYPKVESVRQGPHQLL